MRLATLARKIKMKPSGLISHLEDLGAKLDAGSNTKLDDETVNVILKTYAPELIEAEQEIEEEEIVPAEKTELNTGTETEAEANGESDQVLDPGMNVLNKEWSDELELVVDQTPEEEDSEEIQESKEVNPEDEMEVIRAPKIKLPGLKISGKIELPEPKKKQQEEEKIDDKSKDETKSEISSRRVNKRKVKKISEDYNPLEEARRREAKREERRKKQLAKRRKEMRRKRYEQEIQAKLKPQKPKNPTSEPAEEIIPEETNISKPRNVFSKFWHWLNT